MGVQRLGEGLLARRKRGGQHDRSVGQRVAQALGGGVERCGNAALAVADLGVETGEAFFQLVSGGVERAVELFLAETDRVAEPFGLVFEREAEGCLACRKRGGKVHLMFVQLLLEPARCVFQRRGDAALAVADLGVEAFELGVETFGNARKRAAQAFAACAHAFLDPG